jgi:hypothetical protein
MATKIEANQVVRLAGAPRGERWLVVSIDGAEVNLALLGDDSERLTTSLARVRPVRYRTA